MRCTDGSLYHDVHRPNHLAEGDEHNGRTVLYFHLATPGRVFRNSCGRTSHEDRRVEIEAAENAEPGVAANGVPQQDAAEESTTTLAAARFTVPDS